MIPEFNLKDVLEMDNILDWEQDNSESDEDYQDRIQDMNDYLDYMND